MSVEALDARPDAPLISRSLQLAAGLGALAVGLGAFGAHGLKGLVEQGRLEASLLEAYKTGVQYHFYHVLAIAAVACAGGQLWRSPWTGRAVGLWCAGIVLFSGSLYVMTLSGLKVLGAITPFGGVAFILGWLSLLLAARAQRS